MSDSDRIKRPALIDWAFPLVGIVLALAIAAGLGWLSGGESERRYQSPHRHAESAKANARRACVGTEPSAVFECVYDKVEASEQAAQTEQDLSAQQRAASAALASAIVALVTLIVSVIGVWYVKRTLDATLAAVEDTSQATAAMHKANEIAEQTAQRGMRPYLWPEAAWFDIDEKGVLLAHVHIKNYGQTPAINSRGWIHTWVTFFPLKDALPEPRPGTVEMASGVIGPAAHTEYWHDRPTPIPAPLLDDIKNGIVALYVYGHGSYLDTFGKEHFYRYIYHAHGDSFERRRFSPYMSGNVIDAD